MAKTHPLLLGDDLHQIGFDLVRVDEFRKSEPLRETRDVSIHTDGVLAISVAEHDICGFSSDPGQREQIGQIVGNLAGEPIH